MAKLTFKFEKLVNFDERAIFGKLFFGFDIFINLIKFKV
jgi:hypothetical protein